MLYLFIWQDMRPMAVEGTTSAVLSILVIILVTDLCHARPRRFCEWVHINYDVGTETKIIDTYIIYFIPDWCRYMLLPCWVGPAGLDLPVNSVHNNTQHWILWFFSRDIPQIQNMCHQHLISHTNHNMHGWIRASLFGTRSYWVLHTWEMSSDLTVVHLFRLA